GLGRHRCRSLGWLAHACCLILLLQLRRFWDVRLAFRGGSPPALPCAAPSTAVALAALRNVERCWDKKRPVWLPLVRSICSGVPCATTKPPSAPASGPISMT